MRTPPSPTATVAQLSDGNAVAGDVIGLPRYSASMTAAELLRNSHWVMTFILPNVASRSSASYAAVLTTVRLPRDRSRGDGQPACGAR
jgi:hypothetical protein